MRLAHRASVAARRLPLPCRARMARPRAASLHSRSERRGRARSRLGIPSKGRPMNASNGFIALLCAAGLSACTTMGTGTGSVSSTGSDFSGTYLQLMHDAMNRGPYPDFGVEYSSRVVADLDAAD